MTEEEKEEMTAYNQLLEKCNKVEKENRRLQQELLISAQHLKRSQSVAEKLEKHQIIRYNCIHHERCIFFEIEDDEIGQKEILEKVVREVFEKEYPEVKNYSGGLFYEIHLVKGEKFADVKMDMKLLDWVPIDSLHDFIKQEIAPYVEAMGMLDA